MNDRVSEVDVNIGIVFQAKTGVLKFCSQKNARMGETCIIVEDFHMVCQRNLTVYGMLITV